MKASSESNPHSPIGRSFGISPSAYALSRSSQTSVRPGTSEIPRLSFASEASLHDTKPQTSMKKRPGNIKATTEADIFDEETPGVSRRRALTKVINNTSSGPKPSKPYKSVVLNLSNLPNEAKSTVTEKIIMTPSKRNGILGPESRNHILSSPFNLEKMFPRKISLARNRKRRKSCHCEWCGGLSSLEKKLNRNPLLTRTPRRKKKKEEINMAKEDEQISSRERMSRTSLGGSRGKSKTSRSNSKGKSLFHSKTLGAQKLGGLIGPIKPFNPLDIRTKSIEKDEKSNKSLGDVMPSCPEDNYQENAQGASKNASLVIEQEEEEVQNASIEDLHESKFQKSPKAKKTSPKVKLDIKMRKVSQSSNKGIISPHNVHSANYKRSSIQVASPLKKIHISEKSEKTSGLINNGALLTDKPYIKASDSPKFAWDKFTNQASDIISVYKQKQTLSPHFASMTRTITEPRSQPRKTEYSIFAVYKGVGLSKKQASEPSFMIKSHQFGWRLSNHRSSTQENENKSIGMRRATNMSEMLLSPVRLNTRSEKRAKVYSAQNKVREK